MSHFPCPYCSKLIDVESVNDTRPFPCPHCGVNVTAPAGIIAAISGTTRTTLPAPRSAGEKPRNHSIDTRLALGEPSTLNQNLHGRTRLPTQRQKDRPINESIPTNPADLVGRERSILPNQRQINDSNRHLPITAHPLAQSQKIDDAQQKNNSPDTVAEEFSTPIIPRSEPAAEAKKEKSYLRKNEKPGLILAPKPVDQKPAEEWGTTDPYEVNRRRARRWALGVALIGLPLFSYMVWRLFQNQKYEQKRNENQNLTTNSHEETLRVRFAKATNVATAFLAAKTIEEQVQYVRHPEITRARMEKWHGPRNPVAPTKIIKVSDVAEEITLDNTDFLVLNLTLKNAPYPRSMAFELVKEGDYKIDWESFVCWSDPTWQEFLTKNPTTANEYRVIVTPDDYYNYEYKDSSKYLCYHIQDVDSWGSCYAYLPVDSVIINRMTSMIKRQRRVGRNSFKAILKLRFEENSRQHNQCLIEDLVEDGWLKPQP